MPWPTVLQRAILPVVETGIIEGAAEVWDAGGARKFLVRKLAIVTSIMT